MFISRVKSKGNYYFYAYIYDNSSERGKKQVYSFGRREKALSELSMWRDRTRIPGELIDLGLAVGNIEAWRKKIEAV